MQFTCNSRLRALLEFCERRCNFYYCTCHPTMDLTLIARKHSRTYRFWVVAVPDIGVEETIIRLCYDFFICGEERFRPGFKAR